MLDLARLEPLLNRDRPTRQPDRRHQLHTHGVKKRQHEDFDPLQARTVLDQVSADLLEHPLPQRREAASAALA